ncbi:uncharacterized protein B0J16DRAFT_294575 [Fusarium flagelliforme]|uniref:uncharacterized protein n=1 Tax=Fusarium flagelliforme TaxID=2675880 RepID=UPI001E8D07FD|nr:uncharacterized protein B0J16DRAFT_294575 [Fusarium flagelliforme]KAH7174048.1 hypothetical protein B0J16DRAFT_294575 [Fusarium flagelliforme]
MSSRRRHRKSRYGCTECKRRHIKCDETKPVCCNCSIANRDCSFVFTTVSTCSPNNLSPSVGPSPTPSSSASLPRQNPDSACQDTQVTVPDLFQVSPANLSQLELLHYFVFGSLEFPIHTWGSDELAPSVMVREALDCGYLMNEILGFSARYLATTRPEKRSYYLHQAKEYQTHALSLFNNQQVYLMQEDRLRLVLFSWLLGNHHLCDVAGLDDDENEGAIVRFLHYLKLYRGVRTATSAAWESLLTTEFHDMLKLGADLANASSCGHQTSSLDLLIRESLGMTDVQKKATSQALGRIQWVFDAYEQDGREKALPRCFNRAFSWPLSINGEFLELLESRRPEAMLVLAHFAVLLHWCRDHWIFDRLGACLFDSIMKAIGQGWERWLQWPREMIGK